MKECNYAVGDEVVVNRTKYFPLGSIKYPNGELIGDTIDLLVEEGVNTLDMMRLINEGKGTATLRYFGNVKEVMNIDDRNYHVVVKLEDRETSSGEVIPGEILGYTDNDERLRKTLGTGLKAFLDEVGNSLE